MGKEFPILVVDDDSKIVSLICYYLEQEGFTTVVASDGLKALELALKQSFTLVVVDLELPGLPGMEVCRRIRERSAVPILVVTCTVDVENKVACLRQFADDYVTKPFSPRELVARIVAILRRAVPQSGSHSTLRAHGVEVDVDRRRVLVDDQEVYMTTFEFNLLVALMERPGWVYTREQLLAKVSPNGGIYVVDRTIDVHIGKLRRKLEQNAAKPERILTVRGVGYKFREVDPE